MTYPVAVLLAVLLAVLIDVTVFRTVLVRRRAFWVAYAIVLFFQLIVNGLLTGLSIVRYDPSVIIGWRIAYAPVEDVLFGFAMVLGTLSLWVRLGRRGGPPRPRAAPPSRQTPAERDRPGRGR